jgi:hypothetical protein
MPTSVLADVLDQAYRRHLAVIVSDLRDLADEVERTGAPRDDFVQAPRYSWCAHNAQHAILWRLANLHLDRLTLDAAEADAAYARQVEQ